MRENCGNCLKCLNDPRLGLENPVLMMMVVCLDCGNKRCPKASDHELACSGSNERGQRGSAYD